jgi:hypothetical protein
MHAQKAKSLRFHSADFKPGPEGWWKLLELVKSKRWSGVLLKMLDQGETPLGPRVGGNGAPEQDRRIFDPAVVDRDLRKDAHCIGVHRVLGEPVAKEHLRFHAVARAQRGRRELKGDLLSRVRNFLRRRV